MSGRTLTLKSCAVAGPGAHSDYSSAVRSGYVGTESEFFGQLAGMAWYTPEMFGAKGDGTTNDTDALQAALDSGHPVVANKTYAVTTVTVKETILRVNGTIKGQVRISNNAIVEGGTIKQTTDNPCVLVESTLSGGAGYMNSKLRDCCLIPTATGIGIKAQGTTNALFGFSVEDVDIANAKTSIWLYTSKWLTKCDFRNIYCHSPETVIKVENTTDSRSNLAGITFSNVYAQHYGGAPSYFVKVEDKAVELTLYDSFVYDGIESCFYYVPSGDTQTKISLFGMYCGGMKDAKFSNRSSVDNFWIDNDPGSLDPHWLKCANRREMPIDKYGMVAPEAWTGGPSTRFVGLVSRAGSNFGGTVYNDVSGLSWYKGRLVLLASTDGTVENGTYIEVTTPKAGGVYTTATLPADAGDGATVWCSDIKMAVTYYDGAWYKPDGTALSS